MEITVALSQRRSANLLGLAYTLSLTRSEADVVHLQSTGFPVGYDSGWISLRIAKPPRLFVYRQPFLLQAAQRPEAISSPALLNSLASTWR